MCRRTVSAAGRVLACAALAAAVAVCGGTRAAYASDAASSLSPKTVDEVWGQGDSGLWQERFLTEPESRIVLNANDDDSESLPKSVLTSSQASPLNIAYLGPSSKQQVTDAIQVTDAVGAAPAGDSAAQPTAVLEDFSAKKENWTGTQTNTELTFDEGSDTVGFPFGTAKGWAIARTRTVTVEVDAATTLSFSTSCSDSSVSFGAKATIGGKDYVLGQNLEPGDYTFNLAHLGVPTGSQQITFQIVETHRDSSGAQTAPSQQIDASFSNARLSGSKAADPVETGESDAYETDLSFPGDNATWRDQAREAPTFSDGAMTLKAADGYSVAQLVKQPYVYVTPSTVFTFKVRALTGGTVEVKAVLDGKETKMATGLSEDGTYRVNLYRALGSSALGYHRLNLMLAVVTTGATADFTDMAVAQAKDGSDEVHEAYATSYSTTWRPDYLGYSASFRSGLEVQGSDYFYDASTVVRQVTGNGKGSLHVAGKVPATVAAADASGVSGAFDNAAVGVAFSRAARSIAYYASYDDMLNQRDPSSSPIAGGVFYADFSDLAAGDSLYIAYSMGTADTDASSLASRARAAAADASQRDVRADRTAEVNGFYAKIPVPQAVDLSSVGSKGVTAEDELKSYYKAWDIIRATLLPSNPELGFDHVSFAASKAHMWADGDSHTWYAAAWETFYAMIYYSYVDPATAWDAFEGQMSLVGSDGALSGEGLPVNRARTALILYGNSDPASGLAGLKDTYEAIDRNLAWALENPHWVDKKYTGGDDQKDVDFLAAALADIPYMEQIYRVLGERGAISQEEAAAKTASWEQTRAEYLAKYEAWNFQDGQSYGKVDVDAAGNVSNLQVGNDLMTLKGLYVDDLSDDAVASLMDRFKGVLDVSKDFAGFDSGKYEEFAYVTYGLMDRGSTGYANDMIRTSIRDAVRSHTMGEVFRMGGTSDNTVVGDAPHVEGVAPSVFGAAQMIDSMWMANGLRTDGGQLAVHGNAAGAVANIHRGGSVYSYSSDGSVATVTKDGATDAVALEDSGTGDTRATISSDGEAEVDKTRLEAQISQGRAVGPTGFDAKKYQKLEKAVKAAEKVDADKNATAQEAADAAQAVQAAREALHE